MPKSSPQMSFPKLQSWQIFHYARKHLGLSALYAMFGKKNSRSISRYCEDPRTTARKQGAFDPLQGCRNLITAFDDHGHFGEVRATIAYLAEGTCCDTDMVPEIVEPKPSMIEEQLPDYEAVAAFHTAINRECEVQDAEQLMHEAVAEIERTFARYRKDIAK